MYEEALHNAISLLNFANAKVDQDAELLNVIQLGIGYALVANAVRPSDSELAAAVAEFFASPSPENYQNLEALARQAWPQAETK